jgi:8-oxoguanine deaminase
VTLIRGAEGIFTGLPGEAMRAKGAIRIADGRIAEIGALTAHPGEDVIDASGCVIYPGLISTHHHLFQSILKGVRSGIDSSLHVWLRAVAYSFWHKIDEEALRVAARIGLAELLLSGTTTAADHHYLFAESYRFDPAHVIFEVAQEFGLRLVFCRGGATKARTFDIPGLVPTPTEPLERMIKSVEACAQRYHDPSPGSVRRVAFAPTNPPYSVEPGELKEIAAAARGMGLRIHGHLSECAADVDYCVATFGKRPVEWIAGHDWLGPDVWFAHLVHIDDREIDLLVETGTGVAHCPQSNCRLGSGVAPAEKMAALGGAVSLAVDGAASNEAADMISEMHSAWHVHRAVKGAAAARIEDVVRWASAGGGRVLGFPDLGVIAPGKLADIAIFDLSHPRYYGLHDPLSGPVAAAGAAHLRYLLVGGRVVVKDGAIPGLDLAQLRHDAARIVARLAA